LAEPFAKEQHSPGRVTGDDNCAESHGAAPRGTEDPEPPCRHQHSRSRAWLEEGKGSLHSTEGWGDADVPGEGPLLQWLHKKSLSWLERAMTSEEEEV